MKYLLAMPDKVLFGKAKAIEKWCKTNNKCRPTLLDLELARAQRKAEK